jgi:hypothetical protein
MTLLNYINFLTAPISTEMPLLVSSPHAENSRPSGVCGCLPPYPPLRLAPARQLRPNSLAVIAKKIRVLCKICTDAYHRRG